MCFITRLHRCPIFFSLLTQIPTTNNPAFKSYHLVQRCVQKSCYFSLCVFIISFRRLKKSWLSYPGSRCRIEHLHSAEPLLSKISKLHGWKILTISSRSVFLRVFIGLLKHCLDAIFPRGKKTQRKQRKWSYRHCHEQTFSYFLCVFCGNSAIVIADVSNS